jgi:suppressor of ftsI/bilirubin oxidase
MKFASRRRFLGSAAALGAAYAARAAFAQTGRAHVGAPPGEAAAIEREAAPFTNPLRLPGASGLYGVMPISEFREVRVMRTELELLPGKRTPYLAYAAESGGKRFLNPTLLARRGDQIRVRMVNQLDEPTIIHWHGLRNDARNDGTGLILAQPGEAFEYAFKVQDRASMYFYHPHPHGYIPGQVYHGLAGLLFVDDEEEAELRRKLDLRLGETEIPIVLQDRSFDAEGRLQYQISHEEMIQGFLGERLLVNLTERPFMRALRRIYRFRVLNGSNARTYQLAFLQGGRKLGYYLAGTDGGLLASPQRSSQSFISPGQRLDILLDLREAKEGPVTLATLSFDPMHAEGSGHGPMTGMDHKMAAPGTIERMAMEGEPRALLRIDVGPVHAYTAKVPARLSKLPAANVPAEAPRSIKFAQDAKGNWTINGWTYDANAVPLTVKRGAAETWLIENERASMPHPMHIHGFQFRVLERRGSPEQVRALAGAHNGLLPQDRGVVDTVHVWPGEAVLVALDFSHAYPGEQDYVFHCHNLEHAEVGMMIRYRVTG